MVSNIQILHPLNMVQPNTCIQLDDITHTPWGSQNQQVIVASVINNIVQNATLNSLRTMLFNCYAMNGWNNQPFIDHVETVIKLVTKQVIESNAVNKPQQVANIIGSVVAEANKAVLGEIMESMRQNGMISYLTQDEINGASMLINVYRQLQVEANQPIQQEVVIDPEDDWVECTSKEWRPSKEQPYIRGYNPNTHISKFFKNGSGKVKQEIIEIGCNIDARTTPLTHALFEKKRDEMNRNLGREVSDKEVADTIIREKLNRMRIPPAVDLGYSDNFASKSSAFVSSSYLRLKMLVDGSIFPLSKFSFGEYIITYIKKDDQKSKVGRCSSFISELISTESYEEAVRCMRKYADTEISDFWNWVNSKLTEEFNTVVSVLFGIPTLTITDFTGDVIDLSDIVKKRYGDYVHKTMTNKDNYFISKFFVLDDPDVMLDICDKVNIYEDEDQKYDMFLTRTLNRQYMVEKSSEELGISLSKYEHAAIPHSFNKYTRNLCEDIIDECEDVYGAYLYTCDGKHYRIFRGALDPNQCLIQCLR